MDTAFLENHRILPDYIGLNRTYQVELLFMQKKKNTIQYKVRLICIKKINDKGYVFQINRNNYKINNQPPFRIMEKMAYQAGEILSSLQLLINFKGEITAIYNMEDIRNKWYKEIKKNLKKNFSGKYVNKYNQLIEECLSSENKFIKKLSHDWFLSIYFMTLYKGNKEEVEINKYFPLITDAKQIKYQTTFLEEEANDERLTWVKMEGILKDPRSKMDLQVKVDDPYFPKEEGEESGGYCEGTFLLNKQKKTLWKAEINTEVFLEQGIKRVLVSIQSLEPPDQPVMEKKTILFDEEKEYQYYLERKKRKIPFLELLEVFLPNKK